MHAVGAFELHIEPGTETRPMRVSICLVGAVPDDRGVLHLSPDCMRLDDLEGCINALQDELNLLRVRARGAFAMAGAGHA